CGIVWRRGRRTVRDMWYGDNRGLLKWGVLLRLACIFEAERILQLAFYRPSEFGRFVIDGQEHELPEEVIAHFRNLRTISGLGSKVRVSNMLDFAVAVRAGYSSTLHSPAWTDVYHPLLREFPFSFHCIIGVRFTSSTELSLCTTIDRRVSRRCSEERISIHCWGTCPENCCGTACPSVRAAAGVAICSEPVTSVQSAAPGFV